LRNEHDSPIAGGGGVWEKVHGEKKQQSNLQKYHAEGRFVGEKRTTGIKKRLNCGQDDARGHSGKGGNRSWFETREVRVEKKGERSLKGTAKKRSKGKLRLHFDETTDHQFG